MYTCVCVCVCVCVCLHAHDVCGMHVSVCVCGCACMHADTHVHVYDTIKCLQMFCVKNCWMYKVCVGSIPISCIIQPL